MRMRTVVANREGALTSPMCIPRIVASPLCDSYPLFRDC